MGKSNTKPERLEEKPKRRFGMFGSFRKRAGDSKPKAGGAQPDDGTPPSWFFDRMSREEAEQFLNQPETKNGTFVVRNVQGKEGVGHVYTLSVRQGVVVKHLKIRRQDPGQLFIDHGIYFPSLFALIDSYSHIREGVPRIELKDPSCQWEVPYESLTFMESIGMGKFAEVYKGMYKETTVAIKTSTLANLSEEAVDNEFKVLKDIQDSKILKMLAVARNGRNIYLVTEYMERGDLLKYLKSRGPAGINQFQQIDIGAQVAAGMAYLEVHQYIHSDLAARNILVADDTEMLQDLRGNRIEVKITDFGMAKVLLEGNNVDEHKHSVLPIKWTAPEVLTEKKFTSSKSDVWSFGIFLTELVTYGKPPYYGMNNKEVYTKVTKEGYHMDRPDGCITALYHIMLDCWHQDPDTRPTFATLQWELEGFFTEENPYESPAAIAT